MSGFASTWLNRIQGMVGGQTNGVTSAVMDWMTTNGTGEGGSVITTIPVVSNPEDKKMLEKVYKLMETVIRDCQQPKLNLKSSPPFILDILPAMSQLISHILTQCPDALETNEYLKIYIANLQQKCKDTHKLFRNADIFMEDSASRSSLTVQSLVFSHMLFELKAQFPDPDNIFVGSKFRITKKDAADFWQSHFNNRTIVPWEEFRSEFSKVHRLQIGVQTSALLQTIDLTRNNYISNFEFDVFTRLFHPWSTLIQNWQCLAVTHPAYMSFITYEEVKRKLQRFIKKPGSYVFRLSCTRLGQWAIGYVAKDQKIFQTIPTNKSLIQSLVDGYRDGFYLYPMGKEQNIDLSFMLQRTRTEDRVKVTSEQYQIYCQMGTTFEMCKICDERDKDVKLEPCGHLMCRPCLMSWQESEGGKSCPWCRSEIKGHEKIIIDAYRPSRDECSGNDGEGSSAGPSSSRCSRIIDSEKEEAPQAPPPPIPPKRASRQPPPPLEAPPSLPPTVNALDDRLIPPQIPPRKSLHTSASASNVISDICNELSTIDFNIPPPS